MAEKNIHQTWGDNIKVAFRDVRNKAKAAHAVPFGQERLTPAESKARFAQMSQAEREKFIASRGPSEVIKILKGDA